MNRYIITCIALLFFNLTNAQVPEPTILTLGSLNGDILESLYPHRVSTYDGGFIIAVSSNSKNGNITNVCSNYSRRNIFLKYNSDGSILEWSKCIENNLDTIYNYVFPQKNGDYIYAGFTNNSAVPDPRSVVMFRESSSGSKIWGPKSYGGSGSEILRHVIQTKDDGFLLLSSTNSADGDVGKHFGGQFNNDTWALKLDSNGNVLWSSVFGGTDEEQPAKVIERQNGKGYYLVSYTLSSDSDCINNHGSVDLLVVNIDTAGNKKWSKCYGGSDNDGELGLCAILTSSNDLLVAVHTSSSDGDITATSGYSGVWLATIDSFGSILSQNTYGTGTTGIYPYDLCQANDNSIWIVGGSFYKGQYVNDEFGKRDAFIMHLNSDGSFLNSKVIGSIKNDEGRIIHALSDNTVFVAGVFEEEIKGNLPIDWLAGDDLFVTKLAPWPVYIYTNNQNESIKIYPNPATNELFVELKDISKHSKFQLLDVTGRIVYESKVKKKLKIDVTLFQRGTYILKIKSDVNTTTSKIELL